MTRRLRRSAGSWRYGRTTGARTPTSRGLLVKRDAAAALEHARRAHELVPNDVRVASNLADTYVRCGQRAEALALLRRIAGELRDDDPLKGIFLERIRNLGQE